MCDMKLRIHSQSLVQHLKFADGYVIFISQLDLGLRFHAGSQTDRLYT